jgi:hypothetical protein
MSKLHLKLLILNQRIAARKSIVRHEARLHKVGTKHEDLLKQIANERKFLAANLDNLNTTREVISAIHKFRHRDISKTSTYKNCFECKMALEEVSTQLPEFTPEPIIDPKREEELKPRFGNLLAVLSQEVADEKAKVESKNFPSQNDLTRWALKDAVLAFYQGLNMPENTVVVDTLYDDRLVTQLAPDFDVIARIWMDKLKALVYRQDKYSLDDEEMEKAEADLADGMRGSAFEKQLDRYREEFMQKLKR